MRSIELTARAEDGILLAGTLTLPSSPGPHPAVLLLHGSGKLDRDANAGRLRTDLGPQLAASLASQGLASLRYDRRGVGATPGDWLSTGFLQNRADAAAVLRALHARTEVLPDAVAVLGHSEGATHATWLAAHAGPAAAVLLAGPMRRGDDAIRWQARTVTRNLPAPLRYTLARIGARQLARVQASSKDVLRVGGSRLNARWWRELLAHDPRADLDRIRVPLLAVTGEKDVQVDVNDLDAIEQALPAAEVWRVADLTHLLRRDEKAASILSYPRLLRQPADAALLADVSTWLAQRLRPDSHRSRPGAADRRAQETPPRS